MKKQTTKTKVLRLLKAGKAPREIAAKLGTTLQYVYSVRHFDQKKDSAAIEKGFKKNYGVRPDFKIEPLKTGFGLVEPKLEGTPMYLDPEAKERSSKARDKQEGGDHYKNMGVEPWDVIDTWNTEQRIGYYRGNALKYTMRMGSKDASASDIAKARHYSEKLLEVLHESV